MPNQHLPIIPAIRKKPSPCHTPHNPRIALRIPRHDPPKRNTRPLLVKVRLHARIARKNERRRIPIELDELEVRAASRHSVVVDCVLVDELVPGAGPCAGFGGLRGARVDGEEAGGVEDVGIDCEVADDEVGGGAVEGEVLVCYVEGGGGAGLEVVSDLVW